MATAAFLKELIRNTFVTPEIPADKKPQSDIKVTGKLPQSPELRNYSLRSPGLLSPTQSSELEAKVPDTYFSSPSCRTPFADLGRSPATQRKAASTSIITHDVHSSTIQAGDALEYSQAETTPNSPCDHGKSGTMSSRETTHKLTQPAGKITVTAKPAVGFSYRSVDCELQERYRKGVHGVLRTPMVQGREPTPPTRCNPTEVYLLDSSSDNLHADAQRSIKNDFCDLQQQILELRRRNAALEAALALAKIESQRTCHSVPQHFAEPLTASTHCASPPEIVQLSTITRTRELPPTKVNRFHERLGQPLQAISPTRQAKVSGSLQSPGTLAFALATEAPTHEERFEQNLKAEADSCTKIGRSITPEPMSFGLRILFDAARAHGHPARGHQHLEKKPERFSLV
ncbi:hypothetical protein DIPPA_70175 [Diplonema papillatum]|nr:hypothetical protein DIPPA_70175 [Diplonema papillatum]